MKVVLRDYQKQAVIMVRSEIKKGNKRVLLVLPTGAGKTHVLGDISGRCIENGHTVLAMMHRRQLVMQMQDRFNECGVESGVIMAGVDPALDCKCQIVTTQTYSRRLKLSEINLNGYFVDAAVVCVDECHHVLGKTQQGILNNYQDKIVIGVTATPTLSSGVGMGEYFNAIVQPTSVQELIDHKFLVPGIYYGPSAPDLSKIKIVAGDYAKKELAKKMNKAKLIGDVVTNWLKIAGELKTMVFAVNVAHSKAIRDSFMSHGVTAEHLDAYSDDKSRDETLDRFRSGETQILTNVGLFTEGTDIPEIQCIVLARPTKSLGLHLQLIGRGARPFTDKENFIVIDHGGNVERLGYYEDDIYWGLKGKKNVAKKKKKREKETKIRNCSVCNFLHEGRRCPQCGNEIKEYKKLLETEAAELVRLGQSKKPKATMQEKRKFYSMLEYERREKGYREGWKAHKYKEKFGVWPRGMDGVGPMEPDKGFVNWLTYQKIKYFKSKDYAAKQEAA